MNTHTCSFVYLLEHVLLFLDDNVDKDVHNFEKANVQPQGVA